MGGQIDSQIDRGKKGMRINRRVDEWVDRQIDRSIVERKV